MAELRQVGPMLFKVSGTDKKPEEQTTAGNLWRAQAAPKKTAVDGLLEIPSREQWASSPTVGNDFVKFLREAMGLSAKKAQYLQELITDTYHDQAEKEFDAAQLNGVKNAQADILAKTIAEDGLTDSVYNNKYKETVDSMDILGKKTNKLTFRNPNEGEKVGRQRFGYIDENGKYREVSLLVPERESVGYGNIRGWGAPENSAFNGNGGNNYAPLLGALGKSIVGYEENSDAANAANSIEEGMALLGALPAAAIDTVLGRPIALNATKQSNSSYDGEHKAVGLGEEGDSEGQIFGLIDDAGNKYGPKEAKKYLSSLQTVPNNYSNGYEINRPSFEQEHTGPAYVPGDILLSILGLQPNRGAVGFTFPEYNYSDFIKNYRKASGGK